jgi:hypothetical protein
MRISSAPFKIVILLLVTGVLNACATASIKESWRNPSAPATVYQKVLVVAITQDENVRTMFENILATTLKDHGVMAVQSHTLLPSLDKANREMLQDAARKAGTDGVIISRPLSKSEATNYQYATGEVQFRAIEVAETDGNTSSYLSMSAVGIAAHETDFEKATIQSTFFDAATASVVWTARSKVQEAGERAKASWALAKLLVEGLRKDRVIEGH